MKSIKNKSNSIDNSKLFSNFFLFFHKQKDTTMSKAALVNELLLHVWLRNVTRQDHIAQALNSATIEPTIGTKS